jgi:hypothetical protein
VDVPPGRREVVVNKSLENGGLGISIKGATLEAINFFVQEGELGTGSFIVLIRAV